MRRAVLFLVVCIQHGGFRGFLFFHNDVSKKVNECPHSPWGCFRKDAMLRPAWKQG